MLDILMPGPLAATSPDNVLDATANRAPSDRADRGAVTANDVVNLGTAQNAIRGSRSWAEPL